MGKLAKGPIIIIALLAAASGACTGCAYVAGVKYFGHPDNPFPNAGTFAVAPFVNLTSKQVSGLEIADVFAGELAQFKGFQVRRPAVVMLDARQNEIALPLATVADAVKLAQASGTDAIVVAAVTEYDPYYPPRVAIALQVIYAGRRVDPAMNITPWVESGKPITVSQEDSPRLLAMFEDIFDSNDRLTRLEIQGYAKTHVAADRVFEEEETFLRVMDKYMQFVSNRLIRKIIETERRRQDLLKKNK
jgi:hypothetical protein